jgi:hypothetical protein
VLFCVFPFLNFPLLSFPPSLLFRDFPPAG